MIQVNIALEEVNSKYYFFYVNSGKHDTLYCSVSLLFSVVSKAHT